MASAQSTQPATAVHSHPLSPQEIVPNDSRGRRARPRRSDTAGSIGYFTPRPARDPPTPGGGGNGDGASDWDGSVRRLGAGGKQRPALGPSLSRAASEASLSAPAPPLLVVDASDAADAHTSLDAGAPDARTAEVLGTRWHEYGDAAIQAAVARLDARASPADAQGPPYHHALRVLSAAVHSLSRARIELEEQRRALEERERERRLRAERLVDEMNAHERDVARRVLQSLFPDDNEGVHRVERKQSRLVGLLCPFQR
jgi:small G protein signaling modulator 3